MMNEKAKELGCKDTHFVTPNGLDAEDEGGIHHTTARDLALDHGVCHKKCDICSYHPDQRLYISRIFPEKNIIRFIIPMLFWIWRQA